MRATAWLALDCDARRGFPRLSGRDRRREATPPSSGRPPLGRSSCVASLACAESFNGVRRTRQRPAPDCRQGASPQHSGLCRRTGEAGGGANRQFRDKRLGCR